MGEFVDGLRANGDSGHSYRFKRVEQAFDEQSLSTARIQLIRMGHVPTQWALDRSAHGAAGVIKVQPEMTDEERTEFHRETGFIAEDPVAVV